MHEEIEKQILRNREIIKQLKECFLKEDQESDSKQLKKSHYDFKDETTSEKKKQKRIKFN